MCIEIPVSVSAVLSWSPAMYAPYVMFADVCLCWPSNAYVDRVLLPLHTPALGYNYTLDARYQSIRGMQVCFSIHNTGAAPLVHTWVDFFQI